MENLLSSLERILDVWRQDREHFLELLQPGLTDQEIQDWILNLPFQIPHEVYWLYKWRNGIKAPRFYDFSLDFIPNYQFVPLTDAIKACEMVEDFRNTYTSLQSTNCDKPWFPILSSSDIGYFIVFGSEKMDNSSPVLFLDWSSGDLIVEVKYPNLTTMMAVVADCYEAGAYYLETEVMDQFGTTVEFLKENRQKFNRIQRQHL